MSCERVDTACTRFIVQWVTSATREGWKLRGYVISGRARVSLPRSELSATVTVLPLGDRQARRYSSQVAIAMG